MAYYKHFGGIEIPQVGGGAAAGYPMIAKENEKFSLTNPTIVYEASPTLSKEAYFRLLGAGRYNCIPSVFGGKKPYGVTPYCHLGPVVQSGVLGTHAGVPGGSVRTVDQGQPFQLDEPSTIWYGVTGGSYLNSGPYVGHTMNRGTFMCDNQEFGPDPAYGKAKKCLIVPLLAPEDNSVPLSYYNQYAREADAEDRAQVASQAQENAYQAQIQLQQQNLDAAQESARLAENYLAQQTSAMKSAEAYRQIQQDVSDRAAAITVELARLAALNVEDEEARRAAAEVAIEAENIRQATAKAKADAEKAKTGFFIAQQMTLEELAKQREAAAKLKATEDAAFSEAEQRRREAEGGGGGGEGIGGMDTTTMLLYGGLALAALLLVTD
jgi:hypothetical protein